MVVGTDINAYSTVRSFHEQFGVRSQVIGKFRMGFTAYSGICDVQLVEDLNDDDVFLTELTALAERLEARHPGVPRVLVGCHDAYVRLIVTHAAALDELYRFNTPSPELLETFQTKEQFYALAAQHGLEIPATQFHQVGEPFEVEVDRYPVIVKPSNVIEFWAKPYPGQKKIYRLNSEAEVRDTIAAVEASGYSDSLIIQEYIPGDDTNIWDAILYLNTEGRCELVTLAQVVLQEHEDQYIGAYTAMISRYEPELMRRLQAFHEAVGYTGIANADLKYDPRDGVHKLLEVNVRQGRSSWFAAQLGHDVFGYLVDDVVHQRRRQLTLAQGDALFTVVPPAILRKYVTEPEAQADVRRLLKAGRWGNPLRYRADRSWKRTAFLARRDLRYRKIYANSTWRETA